MSLSSDLINRGCLKTPNIIEAFEKIKREDFVRKEDVEFADTDGPLPIGYGQTISQPFTVAFMLELLLPKRGDKILDVGSGSGWTVALLSHIIGVDGRVYGIERVDELVDFGRENIEKYGYIGDGVAEVLLCDGYQGLPEYAPFDKIIVSAAAERIPDKLFLQLKIGGRMVIPVGKRHKLQNIILIKKIDKNKSEEQIFPGFIFVPLVKK